MTVRLALEQPATVGSLCSGYGGLELGLATVEPIDVRWHADNDAGAAAILAHHWPDVPNLGDLTTVDWHAVEPVDTVCAGFPCQDISHAGHVTDVGLTRNAALKCLGNGVVPQQAALGVRVLLGLAQVPGDRLVIDEHPQGVDGPDPRGNRPPSPRQEPLTWACSPRSSRPSRRKRKISTTRSTGTSDASR